MTTGEKALALVVAGLATQRAVRLVVEDQIMEPVRNAILTRDPDAKNIGYLVTCPYCVGVWAAAAVTADLGLAYRFRSYPIAGPVLALAVAQAAILLRDRDDSDQKSREMAPWPEED